MAQQNIDFGTFPDDPDADAIRTAFQKVQNNFSELYSATSDATVTSVNRSAGAGIQVNSPTGNVIVTANIACVQVSTSTLSIGRDGNGGTSASITQSSQTLVIDLPATISTSNIVLTGNANIGGYANVVGNANVGNLGTAGLITATGNVTGGNLTTTGVVSATGNGTFGNLSATLVTGTLTTNAQPNITSVGTLTSLAVTGNLSSGNANLGNLATANFFSGAGNNLSNIQGANVSGEVSFAATANSVAGANVSGAVGSATVAGTVTTAAQPNITSVGTLTTVNVSGNANVGNLGTGGLIIATGNVTGGNLITAGIAIANSGVQISNSAIYVGNLTTTSTGANQTIATLQINGTYATGVEYLVKGIDSTGTKYSVATVVAVTNGTTADYSTFATVNLGGSTGTLAVNITTASGNSNIALQVTPASSNSTVWTTQYRVI